MVGRPEQIAPRSGSSASSQEWVGLALPAVGVALSGFVRAGFRVVCGLSRSAPAVWDPATILNRDLNADYRGGSHPIS